MEHLYSNIEKAKAALLAGIEKFDQQLLRQTYKTYRRTLRGLSYLLSRLYYAVVQAMRRRA